MASSGDFLGRVGTVLMRKSPRAAVWTAGITSSGYLTNSLGLLPGDFTAAQALAAPILVGGTFLALGVSLRYIPSALWRRLTIVAEANDLNLMEDYRKSQLKDHLDRLWDRVFSYEAALRYSPEQREAEGALLTATRQQMSAKIGGWDKDILTQLGIQDRHDLQELVSAMMAVKPYSASVEASREGFLVSSTYALHNTLPQATQTERIGFGLGLFEDFCDGAYFDPSDQKLFQQYLGNSTLSDCKKQCRYGAVDALREMPLKGVGRLWFSLVTRKVGMGVGKVVRQLNERYQTDRFNAQVFLWPGEDEAAWIAAYPGAQADIRKLRASLLKKVLGQTYADAERVLNGMLLPSFELATDLRMRFDYEYCAGTLDHQNEQGSFVRDNCLSDWQEYPYPAAWVEKKRRWVNRAIEDMTRFTEALARLGLTTPSSGPRANGFSPGKDGEAGDVGSIVDAAGCSQATNKPLEARGGFQTEARIKPDRRLDDPLLLRAVKILFHTDTDAIRTQFRRDAMQLDQAAVHRLIESALTQLDILNHRLMTVRLHHQLTHIQVQGYRALVKSLAYDDPNEKEPAQQKETPMSNPVKIYTYQRCGTCRKALKYLVDKGIEYHDIPIRETPPRKTELKTMLKHLEGRRNLLFNTSGTDYRELKIKDQMAGMTDQDAIDMLNSNGNLVKRPFLLTAEGGLVGFKQDQWDAFF